MSSATERLARRRSRPLLVELHRALGRLTSVLTVMNTGAHPDDEQSGLLALLSFGRGMRVVIACSTRGEGGQNSLGAERGEALGVLRTRELEEAARVLDADIAWLGFGPADPVHDFGFSKNGTDTLVRWGRDRLLERMVRAYRRDRPDIVIPTFLDVPGQHGHHRAMTEAAEAAVALAADRTAFPEHFGEGLRPWTVSKFYLPAWSGGGGTYDDEVPPPDATTRVGAPGHDPATGASYATIGEWSRMNHASQGMGRWTARPQNSWALHLKRGPEGDETDIAANLPSTLNELAEEVGAPAGTALRNAHQAIAASVAAFPHRQTIVDALLLAAAQLETGHRLLGDADAEAHGHRLLRKLAEINAALVLAAGVEATAWVDPPAVAVGGSATLRLHLFAPDGVDARVEARLPPTITTGRVTAQDGLLDVAIEVPETAPTTRPFAAQWSRLGGNGEIGATIIASMEGRTVSVPVDLEQPVRIIPSHSVVLDPDAVVVPLKHLPTSTDISVRVEGPASVVALDPLDGLTALTVDGGFRVALSETLGPGHHRLPLRIGGMPAERVQPVSYPHIGRTGFAVPVHLDILALELELPAGARVGYVGAGSDDVSLWLRRMGINVTELDADALAGDLSGFTSIVVGIFAFGFRPDLAAATAKLHRWVEGGGHLLTLYHRPSDGWVPDRTPPRRIVIGSPSLRWRVTDPGAAVEVLVPEHPLLTAPNRITDDDWAGWDKERGLYFAAEWDKAYVPLIATHDPGEAPLRGALLSGSIGDGRHTHTSLVLHHQMARLVPGAFRVMANLLQPAGSA